MPVVAVWWYMDDCLEARQPSKFEVIHKLTLNSKPVSQQGNFGLGIVAPPS